MGTDSDLDFKPNGYIVLCSTCSQYTDSDSDTYFLFLYRTGIRVRVYAHIRVRQYVQVISVTIRSKLTAL